MSNIVQNEISDSRLKKGKEKVEGGPSKKRSKVWDDFAEEEQPDGSNEAKCLHCGDLICCDTKKHGTNTMRRHLNLHNGARESEKGQFSGINCRNKDARTTLSRTIVEKRSKVWDDFAEEEQLDGSKKAKCLHCGDLICCDTKKHGTNTMRRHLNLHNGARESEKGQFSGINRRNKDARTTLSLTIVEKRAKVWDDFAEEEQPDGSKKAKCLHCGDLICCDTKKHGTNTMRQHLNLHNGARESKKGQFSGINCRNKDARATLLSYSSGNRENHLGYDQQRYTEPTDCQENNLEYDQKKNQELFVRMVIDNKSMLEHVENPFLEEFARSLQPFYRHVTLRDVEKDCLTFYKDEKAKLKDEITKLTSRVSLSVESCLNPKFSRLTSSCCVAAHFINNDFKLVKRIIGIEVTRDGQFDAERILNDWRLSEKAFALTTKNDYIIESAKKLNVECILKCFRSIADVFFRIKHPAISSIERMMKDLNEFPEKMCYFNQIASEHNLPTKLEFLLNNEGVLGSYFNILNDACTYKNVLCPLNDMEGGWGEVEGVVHLLNSINDVIVRLSSLEFPTSNLLLNFVFEIRDVLSEASPVFPRTKDAIHQSLEDLDKYLARSDKIVLIASLLDPRFKLRFLERCIGKVIANIEDFHKSFGSLYNKYQSESTDISRFDCSSQIPELNEYLERSSVEDGDENFDVLGWWKNNKSEYPILARMARDILAIPISSSLNSGIEPVKEIMNEVFVSTVDRGISKVLICCNNWLRSGHSAGIENIMKKRHLNQACLDCSNNGNSCVYDQIKSQELLAKLIISSELPFNFVKSTWFIEWAKNLQPLYTSVDLATIKRLCIGFYQIERQRLPHLYKDPCVRVCFSAHICGVADNKYICVTAHYIDDYFNLVRRIIGIKIIRNWNFPVITAQLDRCIANWEIPKKKVLAFTTAITCNDYNEKFFDWFSCGVGGIKLHCIVQGFNEMFNIILDGLRYNVFESITEMINFLAKDPNAMHIINELAIAFKISSPKSHLQLDDARSWDSTLNMLSDAIAYKGVFNVYKYYDESFPLCGNWNEVESVVQLLKPIYEAIIILSSSQYPTSNLFLKIVFELRDVLSHVVFNTNIIVYDKKYFLDCLLNVLDNYLKDCNSILLVTSLLDPRFKLTYLERCYAEHISDREEINKCIRNLCIEFEIEIRKEDAIEHNLGMLELERYMQEGPMKVREDDFDVLRWWKDYQSNYPILSRIARDNLAIPVSSVPPEFAFYTSKGNKKFRFLKLENQLGPRTMEALVCSYNWLSAASSIGNGAAIDLVEKHIPPSYKCPLRVYHTWSLGFLEDDDLSGRMSEEIVAIGGARLTVEKMQCLIRQTDKGGPDKWISDDVINCYIDIMNNIVRRSGKILILSTFDSQLLQSWGSSTDKREKNCERKSNIIEKGNSFLQNELVFMPIHVQNHWIVGALNASKKKFQLLNSLNSVGGPYEETTHTLRLGIQVCIDAALDSQHALQGWRPDNVLNWPILPISNLPQQEDGWSCGLFALKYMQLWDGSKLACDFTQDDIHLFRKELVGELIFSELNEMKNIQNEIKKKKYEIKKRKL